MWEGPASITESRARSQGAHGVAVFALGCGKGRVRGYRYRFASNPLCQQASPMNHCTEANAEFQRLYAIPLGDAGFTPAEFAQRYGGLPAKQAAFKAGADCDLDRVDVVRAIRARLRRGAAFRRNGVGCEAVHESSYFEGIKADLKISRFLRPVNPCQTADPIKDE